MRHECNGKNTFDQENRSRHLCVYLGIRCGSSPYCAAFLVELRQNLFFRLRSPRLAGQSSLHDFALATFGLKPLYVRLQP